MARVAYSMSDKKSKRLSFDEFPNFCRNAGIELVKLDLDSPLEDQGPFDLIFHKLTDQLAKADQGNGKAREQIERFHTYTKQHPEVVVLDPLESLYKLLDRRKQYQHAQNSRTLQQSSQFFTPAFVEFTSDDVETNKRLMEECGVQYPFVCKPSIAHGSSLCHKMAIIFNEEGLKDVQPPCVAQTFINHNALLYKVFVIGPQISIVERPSIKNFAAGDHQTIFFDSHDVSKADSASFLNEQSGYELAQMDVKQQSRQQARADPTLLRELAFSVQERFNLALFGIDVIIENVTGRYAIIDINSFPGYDGWPNLFQSLVDLIWFKLDEKSKKSKEESDVVSSQDLQPQTFHIRDTKNLTTTEQGKTKGRSDVFLKTEHRMRLLDLDNFPHIMRTAPKEINATLLWEDELVRKSLADGGSKDPSLIGDDTEVSLCKRIEDLLEENETEK